MSNTESDGDGYERRTPHDPLDGAAIGETRTVRESKTLHGINYWPDAFFGSDRQGHSEIVDVEIVKDPDGDAGDIRVTWEGEMTKCLPRNWDRCNEPRTPKEERQHRAKKWLGRVGKVASVVIPLGFATLVGVHATNALAGSMTINGEPMSTTTGELAGAVVLVFALAALIMWGLKGGFPGMAGKRWSP